MQVIREPRELTDVGAGRVRGVVMTMGALHPGHASLLHRAREEVGADGLVIATIFVNPLQFSAGEDFEMYPRTLDADLDICRDAGVDVVFAPSAAAMYPDGSVVTVDPGPLGDILEGASRPGHFRGVLTVVAKLLNITRADVALFGEKDYQQLVVIQRMVVDLFMPVRIVPGPTMREADGLAMSSRNRYLSQSERSLAACVPQALEAAVAAAQHGALAAEDAGRAILESMQDVSIDYFTVRGIDLGEPNVGEPGRILTAVRIGQTRLLDNMACVVGPR